MQEVMEGAPCSTAGGRAAVHPQETPRRLQCIRKKRRAVCSEHQLALCARIRQTASA